MSKPVNIPAAAHFLMGALEKFLKLEENAIPPGKPHDLCDVEFTARFPSNAFVTRGEGTKGGGFNLGTARDPVPLQITMDAMMLFEERCTAKEFESVKKAQTLMESCLRDALKGMKAEPPAWALAALAVVQAEQPIPEPVEPEPRKTAAKRTDDLSVEIEVRRRMKQAVA